MIKNILKFLSLTSPILLLAIFMYFGANRVNAIPDNCPDGGGWVKEDDVNALNHTYTGTVPSGYEIVDNCIKVGSHSPVYGTGNGTDYVENTTLFNSPGGETCTAPGQPVSGCSLQNISHASFLLQETDDEEPEDPTTPYVESSKSCGEVKLDFYNPTDWYFTFDYRVDDEAYVDDGTGDAWYGLTIHEGPLVGQTFGARWHEVGIAGPGSDSKTINFGEDTGLHKVEYRLAEGAEQQMYFDWVTVDNIESDCEDNQVDPSPTPNPSPSPSPSPSTNRDGSVLGVDNLVCPNTSFTAVMDLFKDNNPQEGVEVTFTFNGQEAKSKTNADGRAYASFGIANGTLEAKADGYPTQSQHVSDSDCVDVVLDPQVLGATTARGQVLGATTLANTGVADLYLAWSGIVAGFGSLGAAINYARKKD